MEVRLFATLSRRAGARSVTVPTAPGATAGQVLDHLCERYPGLRAELFAPDGQLLPHVNVFLNGRSIRDLQGLGTSVRDTDALGVFPPLAGGSHG